jgi:hypothetical protein
MSLLNKVAVIFIFLVLLYPARGFCLEIRHVPALPEFEPMSEEEFLQQTKPVEVISEDDPELSFQVRIPKDWAANKDISLRNYILSKKVVGEVARYYSPPIFDQRSSFSVSAMEMEHKITGKNWFIHFLFTKGYTLEGIEVISDEIVKAQYVLMEDDTPYSVRAIAITNGKRIVLAQYYVPLKHAIRSGPMQSQVIDSFRLINKAEEYAEPIDTYSFLDLVEFDYPLSWELRTPAIRDIIRMHAFLVNIIGEDRLYGKIDVNVADKDDTDLAEEIKNVNDKMSKLTTFEIGSLIEPLDKYNFGPHIEAAKVEVYELTSKRYRSMTYEYWMAVLSEKYEYNYIITMITPSREDDFYTWAQNIEVFKLVVESVKPGLPAYNQ